MTIDNVIYIGVKITADITSNIDVHFILHITVDSSEAITVDIYVDKTLNIKSSHFCRH